MAKYYIASCVFSTKFPELSFRIREFVREWYGLNVVRCCVPRYKLKEFTQQIPEGSLRDDWSVLADSADFKPEDEVYSLCHNCNNIIEEMHPDVQVHSLWELINSDSAFTFPDHHGLKAYVQDCWRSRDRKDEQYAVRSLLSKMNIGVMEIAENRERTEFCGVSLYRPQPPRNPQLAPKHYIDGAVGKFNPLPPEEQKEIMQKYCRQFSGGKVICYCHYCYEGLQIGGADASHLAQLLFAEK